MKKRALAVLLFLFAAGHASAAEIVRDIPKDHWVDVCFETIDLATTGAELQPLRRIASADPDHLELRLWWIGWGASGYVVKREGGQWSGREIKQSPHDKSVTTKPFAPPTSTWQVAWDALLGKKLLTLPDFSTLPQSNYHVADGSLLVVETLVGAKYRTYMYPSPSHFDNPECWDVQVLHATFLREFRGDGFEPKQRKFLDEIEIDSIAHALLALKYPLQVRDLLTALPVDLIARNLDGGGSTGMGNVWWKEWPLTNRTAPEGHFALVAYTAVKEMRDRDGENMVRHAEVVFRRKGLLQRTLVLQPQDFPLERAPAPPPVK